jgi:RNA polymerase sigma factor (sigma-70 family)
MYLTNSNTDKQLLDRLRDGDGQVFGDIYHSNVRELYRFLRRNIETKEDCEEIIQNIFVSLWSRREELPEDLAFKPYIFKMARHQIIHYFRDSAVRKKYEAHYKLFEAVYEETNGFSENVTDLKSILDNGLKDLPKRCSDAVKLRILENLPNAEIAKRMNINKGTVENYIVTAVKHMRKMAKEGRLVRPDVMVILLFIGSSL